MLINRYIRPQAPPPGFDSAVACQRFVSTIPYVQDRSAFSASLELWSTTKVNLMKSLPGIIKKLPKEMLQIGAGDEAEHAILLCNYFLHFNMKAFILLGKGIPEGKTAFVLVIDPKKTMNIGSSKAWLLDKTSLMNSGVTLYHPMNGMSYLPSDNHCPLREVACLFNQSNVSLWFPLYLILNYTIDMDEFTNGNEYCKNRLQC